MSHHDRKYTRIRPNSRTHGLERRLKTDGVSAKCEPLWRVTMGGECRCGNGIEFGFHSFGCIECGAGCCPRCAVAVESVTYCRPCADSLLGATASAAGHFELH